MRHLVLAVFSLFITVCTNLQAQLPLTDTIRVRPSINESTISEFMRNWFEVQQETHDIPGLAAVVVRDSETIFKATTGSADNKAPLKTETTLQAGRIAEVITAATIMKEVELGNLSLHADVSPYIPVDISKDYRRGFTLHQLLTHTSGIEHNHLPQRTRVLNRLADLEGYLRENLTITKDRSARPFTYSAEAVTLAAHYTERFTHEPFHSHANRHLLTPLGMADSGYFPIPPSTAPLPTGHRQQLGRIQALQTGNTRTYPASNFYSTLQDMEKFMNFQLGYESQSILSHTTLLKMQTAAEPSDERHTGMAYGFQLQRRNNRHIAFQGGSTSGFYNLMLLIPSEQLGIYLHANLEVDLTEEFLHDFLNHFFPYAGKVGDVPGKADSSLIGYYATSVDSPQRQAKFLFLWQQRSPLFRISYDEDHLQVNGIPHHTELDDKLVSDVDGSVIILYRDTNQNVGAIYPGGHTAFTRTSFIKTITMQRILFVILLGASLTFIILSGYGTFSNSHFGKFGLSCVFVAALCSATFLLILLYVSFGGQDTYTARYSLVTASRWILPYLTILASIVALLGFSYDFTRHLLTKERAVVGLAWLVVAMGLHFFYAYWNLYGGLQG